MNNVIYCIVEQHDIRLLVLAAAICMMACFTTLSVLTRARVASGLLGGLWVAGAAVAFGTGVWTTHFVAMLAFNPGTPTAYSPGLTVASLAAAVLLSLPGLIVLTRVGGAYGRIAAALLVTGAVATMHYMGMFAMVSPGLLGHRAGYVLASLVMGFAFSTAAFEAFRRGRLVLAGLLLVPAVCGLHFIAVTAAILSPSVPSGALEQSIPAAYLALAVAAVGLLSLALGLVAAIVDQRFATKAVQEAKRLRQFVDAASEGILFLRRGRVLDANQTLCRLSGRSIESIVGQSVDSLFGTSAGTWIAAGAVAPLEGELATRDGDPRPVELIRCELSLLTEADTILSVRDLTDRRAAERRIERLAHYDPLTGLANRTLFQERLSQALAMSAGTALLCLDLDRFKVVNDTLGHAAGDTLLVAVAARLTHSLRDADTAARLGGDEFAVIQSMADQPEAAANLAARLIQALSAPYMIEGRQIDIGVSIGIALFPENASDANELARGADVALYRAKHDGRGIARFFEQDMDIKLQQRRKVESDLRAALSNGELALHYQPLFDAGTLQLIGHEALLRWTHPEQGLMSPATFIPVAEETGMIIPIGRWVIETACATAAGWPAPLRMAVNVSPVQFRDAELVSVVAMALESHGLSPDRLELEITESILIDDTKRVLEVLTALKALGVRVVLDDFGTGYSSLSYLRRFPFDKIKIDQSFIQSLGIDQEAGTLVSSIVALARSLQLEVTAEGVETREQLNLLRSIECDQLQGYLLGRPAPAESAQTGQGSLLAAA